jgi:hypothetical protein
MAETVTLATPEITPQITTTDYRVSYLQLDIERASVVIHLRGTNGERKEVRYEGPVASSLMVALNTANLSVKSLQRRILERIITDGRIAGAVSGSPD